MKKIIYQTAFISLILDSSIPAIYENWQGTVSTDEFKSTLEKKLELFCQYRKDISNLNWIVNLKGLRVGEEAQAWANHDFHPKLYPSGIRKIAFVVPEDTLYLLENEQLSTHMDNQNQIALCYFDQLEEVAGWLQQMPLAEGS